MSDKFNAKPNFPITYGDDVENDGERLSDYVVSKFKDKKFRNYLGAVGAATFTLGSFAGPSNAIPPEYGEAAARVLDDIPPTGIPKGVPSNPVNIQQLYHETGQKAAQAFGAAGPQAGPQVNLGAGQPPKPPFVPYIPGPPRTPVGQTANSLALMLSLGVICLNGAWGYPWAAVVCAGGLFKVAENLMASVMK